MTTISGTIVFGLLGLLFGSFINALVWRIHEQRSIAHGRSECPRCHHTLGVWDLIPVFSWLGLGGRCRYCHQPISVQYPLVELATGSLFALSYVRMMPVGWLAWLMFLAWLYILGSLIVLSVYDLRWMLLPDVVTLPAIGVAILMIIVRVLTGANWHVWLGPLAAALLLGGGFYGLAAVSKGKWMGGGDIKLVFLIGLVCGLKLSLAAMFMAFNSAAIISLGMIALKLKKRTDHIPFGPFLVFGCLVAILFGHPLVQWYFSLSG